MIIIEVTGGLGNQMFQYALYRQLQVMGKNVKLDISFYRTKQTLRKLELDIFGISYEVATKAEICRLRGYTSNATRIEKAITTRLYRNPHIYKENLDEAFQNIVFELEDVYLSGYWQNELYFKNIREQILCDFTFPNTVANSCCNLLKKMQETNAVSVHVRRGDYLNPVNSRLYNGICTVNYYHNAMKNIQRYIPNPHFFLFTDDVQWVKQHLYEEGMTVVEHQAEIPDYIDMFLMSQCQGHIIANSTFSWWGAWLDKKKDKVVFSPAKWLNNHEANNAICDWFIKIES